MYSNPNQTLTPEMYFQMYVEMYFYMYVEMYFEVYVVMYFEVNFEVSFEVYFEMYIEMYFVMYGKWGICHLLLTEEQINIDIEAIQWFGHH